MRAMLALASLVVGCGAPIEGSDHPAWLAFDGDEWGDGEPAEVTHEVAVTLDQDIVRLSVHRVFDARDARALSLELLLPSGGSLDGFRATVDGTIYEGEILAADEARDRFALLSGNGDHALASADFLPPALVSWQSAGVVQLEMEPVRAGATVEITYTITLPTCHRDGRAVFDYPDGDVTFSGVGTVRRASATEAWEWACEENATLLEGDRFVLELDALPVGTFDVRFAETPAAGDWISRLAIDVPAQLAPIPDRPTVVFLVDGSISQADTDLADQLGWARAYLTWVPDATVEVVVFHRFAERRFGRFVPASAFDDALAHAPHYVPQNGSNLDEGLRYVADLVTGTAGEVRVVATSDLLLSRTFDVEAAADALRGRGVTLHLVDRTKDEGTAFVEEVVDELSRITEATGGMRYSVTGAATDEAAKAQVEQLVRPISAQLEWGEYVTPLDRGCTARRLRRSDDRVRPHDVAKVRMWSRTVELPARWASDDTLPAIVMGTDLATRLGQEAVTELARAGGVVTPYTSYLAEHGGAGLADAIGTSYSSYGFGISGLSTSCGCGGAFGGLGLAAIDSRAWFEARVRAAASACGAVDGSVRVETTLDEIVAVDSDDACLVEALWAMRLDESFRAQTRGTFEVGY